jgi:hypothetical protein
VLFEGEIMQKLKLMLIPMSIGVILLLLSWCLSYPVSMGSPYDFAFNHFSYLYWLGLATLFVSFFIVAMKTENNSLRWAMAVGTVFLMFSQAYFYFTLPTSDADQFRGLTEYFISTGDLSSLEPYHSYFQWPLFFVLNKIFVAITGLDLRYCEFILYGITGSLFTSFLYLHFSKARKNAHIAVLAFFIILIYFFNFQFWSPFMLSLCLIFLLFYFDSLSEKHEVTLAILTIFTIMTLTHILTPLFFVVYSLVMYILKKNKKHLNLFITTFIIYTLVLSINPDFASYIKQVRDFTFFEYFLGKITVTTAGSIASQPFVDVIAQLFSRTVVIATMLVTFFGFFILLRRRELRGTDYAMLLTGVIFAATLIVAPTNYSQMSNRSYFLLCIPASMGASFLCESKLRKYFKPLFLVLLVLFTFAFMHQSFFDREIFNQTKMEHQYANFMIDTINWSTPASILSPYRFGLYLETKSSSGFVTFDDESSARALINYNYVVYNVGLAKSLIAINYSVEESFEQFDNSHFNLIYNSGNFSYIFSK